MDFIHPFCYTLIEPWYAQGKKVFSTDDQRKSVLQAISDLVEDPLSLPKENQKLSFPQSLCLGMGLLSTKKLYEIYGDDDEASKKKQEFYLNRAESCLKKIDLKTPLEDNHQLRRNGILFPFKVLELGERETSLAILEETSKHKFTFINEDFIIACKEIMIHAPEKKKLAEDFFKRASLDKVLTKELYLYIENLHLLGRGSEIDTILKLYFEPTRFLSLSAVRSTFGILKKYELSKNLSTFSKHEPLKKFGLSPLSPEDAKNIRSFEEWGKKG